MIHPDEPVLEADEIQGNSLRGFDTNQLELLGFRIGDPDAARAWLAALGPRIASLSHVHRYRLRRSAGDAAAQREVLINAAFSRFGLELLGFPPPPAGDGFFNVAMGALAGALGDRAGDYVVGRDRENTPDLVLLLGCQEGEPLDHASREIQDQAAAAGLVTSYVQRGSMLPGEIEHFGFRDGISQVGPRGLLPGDPGGPLTPRLLDETDPEAPRLAQPGRPLVWPGQFVFGYATQTENPLKPGPVVLPVEWMKNGSLLIFRRLQQNVVEFQEFLETAAKQFSAATGHAYTADQAGARVVGRWKDGTPVALSADQPDPTVAQDPLRVNHVGFGGAPDVTVVDPATGAPRVISGHAEDAAGQRCPVFAHVRKVNPRNLGTNQGSAAQTLKFQMLRRGIPYGPLFGKGREQEDRGLLFLAYMTSFKNQFQILNRDWMNNPEAPEKAPGHDVLVGQAKAGVERFGVLRDALGKEKGRLTTEKRFVVPSGGAFLFSPACSFFSRLAG